MLLEEKIMVTEVVGSQAASSEKHSVSLSAPTASPEVQKSSLSSPVPVKPVKDGPQQAAASVDIPKLVDSINNRPQVRERSLQFSVHEGTGKMQVRIYDSNTHELIRQMPSDEMLRIAEQIDDALAEDISGIILQDQA